MNADNQIDYIEFQAADLGATRTFFEQLFGWKFTDYGPDYTSFEDGRIAGGFSRAAKRSTIESGGVLVVFYHPRLEEVRQRVIDLGGASRPTSFLPAGDGSTCRAQRQRVRDLVGRSGRSEERS
jgi:predicted enzyme related to lactoylglutathione lyase